MIYALAALGAAILLLLLLARLGLFDDRGHLCEVCFDEDADARVCRGCANRAAGLGS